MDRDPARLAGVDELHVLGDVTDDKVLAAAGIDRAYALITALDTDADNVFVTLSARALRPDMVIIARARDESSMAKLVRAGADRVVNPQLMGGRRMAAFALQPHVADFLDVVMHDDELDYRLEQIEIGARFAARPDAAGHRVAERTGALLLALHTPDGRFLANPDQATPIEPGSVLIMLGTPAQLASVRSSPTRGPDGQLSSGSTGLRGGRDRVLRLGAVGMTVVTSSDGVVCSTDLARQLGITASDLQRLRSLTASGSLTKHEATSSPHVYYRRSPALHGQFGVELEQLAAVGGAEVRSTIPGHSCRGPAGVVVARFIHSRLGGNRDGIE